MAQEPEAAAAILDRVLDAARRDRRVVGVLVGGSLSEGRGDAYSDLDLALFVADDDLASFEREWKAWAGQFGRLLLAYVGGVGHPWAVYDAEPLPLRVDFSLWPATRLEVVSDWPIAPTSLGSMVRHDATGGRLSELARPLVGQSLAPRDLERAFESACGDFWYYLLRIVGKLARDDRWGAHWELQVVLVGSLLALLRLESGAVDRWRGMGPAHLASRAVPAEHLAELESALPKSLDQTELRRTLRELAREARRVCSALRAREGWEWPEELADRIELALSGRAGDTRGSVDEPG